MKSFKSIVQVGGIFLVLLLLTSCGGRNDAADDTGPNSKAAEASTVSKHKAASSLPKQFQRPAYMIGDDLADAPISTKSDDDDDVELKVGATIRSTTGPQPLWTIMKWLAELKNMNVSWASDVDNKVLVDVDINANDDFYTAIDNLLRQVDYYHEMQGNTIVVKYKETRQYQLGMPFTKHKYSTGIGGNVLGGGGNDAADNLEGTIALSSKDNEYDFWATVDTNLNQILQVWKTDDGSADDSKEGSSSDTKSSKKGAKDKDSASDIRSMCQDKWGSDYRQVEYCIKQQTKALKNLNGTAEAQSQGTRRMSGNQNMYFIDKSIGLITVTAPRPILEKVDDYIASLKSRIYKQINIEAKIIEVSLDNESNIGINWDSVLKDFSLSGVINYGDDGQIWPYIFSGSDDTTTNSDGSYQKTYDPTRFVTSVTMNSSDYQIFLNALNEEGKTTVLSNPKISLLNGQAAMITVGQNESYVSEVTVDVDDDGDKTYSAETDDILSGLGMALTATVGDNDQIIMNLTPVVSELQDLDKFTLGDDDNLQLQLPTVNIREMSTTVRVKSGETLVIGGLINDNKTDSGSFLPILGDIPVLKYLFGYETKTEKKTELIILLKPVLL